MVRVHGFEAATPPAVRRRVALVLALAVLGISSSSVLVRGMRDADPVAIAAWRTLGSAILLSGGIAAGWRKIARSDLVRIGLAGLALAAHFAVWFASLDYTTVMRSTVLVCLVPLWSGLLEWWVVGRAPRRQFWVGLAVALPGIAILSARGSGGGALLGDLLALLGGVLWAVYLLIGRSVRQRVGITAYMGLVCAAATVPLWPLALALGQAVVGFARTTWLLILGAILGPQLLGHQGANYAVRYLPASVVAAVMLLEPVGATVLAALILEEQPSLVGVLGGALALAGVMTATLSWENQGAAG